MDNPVLYERRGKVAYITLNRPESLNAMNGAMTAGLRQAWRTFRDDRDAWVAIITGAGERAFCAGADVKAFTRMDASGGSDVIERGHALLRSFEQSRTMTIAAVNGLALGGGCELAMACDVRLAASSASFGQPEIGLGIIPGFGGTQRLPRLVGPAKALEMNTTGAPVAAEEAYEFGLVNRVVADHELFDTALAWARKLAEKAPIAVQQIKSVSAMGELGEGLEAEAQGFARAFTSEDAKEGISAFLSKRQPRFQGK